MKTLLKGNKMKKLLIVSIVVGMLIGAGGCSCTPLEFYAGVAIVGGVAIIAGEISEKAYQCEEAKYEADKKSVIQYYESIDNSNQ